MASQDWLEKDFYKILGVSKDADDKTIKKAYRQLARTYHPDKNPGDSAAEEKFKAATQAYQVLSDKHQRQEYDQIRAFSAGGARFTAGGPMGGGGFEDIFSMFSGSSPNGGFSYGSSMPGGQNGPLRFSFGGSGKGAGGGGAGAGAGGFSDIFSMFSGAGAQASKPQKGEDLQARVRLTFRQAVNGATVQVKVNDKRQTVKIPPGVAAGKKVRLPGKGKAGINGGAPGDICIEVQVDPHPVFALEGANVRVVVPLTFVEVALGATVEVPTLDGSTVKVKVPAGTANGHLLRVKGRGLKLDDEKVGDLLLEVSVLVPTELTEEQRRALADFAQASPEPAGSARAQLIEIAKL